MNTRKSNKKINNIGQGLFVLLFVTAIMLVTVLSLVLININAEKNDEDDIEKEQITETNEGTTDTSVINVSVNNSPLFVTRKSRESYVIGQASDVKTIDSTSVKSQHSILVDLESYKSIAEKDADAKIYPASMTKVMTLVVICERITDLNEMLTVTESHVEYMKENEGSGVGLKAGESYKVEDLLYLISYQSDTVASILLAEHIAGSEEAFVGLMNDKVKELGLTATNFANCTGLYDDDNYTTCREMATIMAYALDNEMAYKCLTSYTGRAMTIGGNTCKFYSGWYSSRLRDNPKFTGGKVIAGKTGYTDESGYTLVSCADIDGKKYINVIVTRTNKESSVKVQEEPSGIEVKYIYKTYS